MGFFSGLKSFFTGDDSGEEAAKVIAAANRLSQEGTIQQFGETKANLDPFITAGLGGLEETVQGSTAGGFADRLTEIFGTDIFKTLLGERTRAVEGQLAAGGLTRSGGALETIANIPTEIGLALEQLFTSRSAGLAGTGQEAIGELGRFGVNKEAVLGNLRGSTASAQAQGIIRDAASERAGFGNILSTIGRVGGAGLGAFGIGGAGAGFSGGGISRFVQGLFSDRRLKENVFVVGEIMNRDGFVLKIYQWDWVPETDGTIIQLCPSIGLMADEVRKIYPQHVYKFGGFDVLDYEAIRGELEYNNG